ncbi:MAG: lytic transglycosylase domain-containing protein [Methylocella sp.]
MQLESNGDTTTVSPKGAMGLMQIMPETYAELRLRHQLGADPYAPRNNILAGAAYLREMRDRYGPAGFLAAYNAGPGRYEDYLTRGRPLPKETHNYVGMLASMIGVPAIPRHPESALVTSRSPAFVAAHDNGAQSTALNKTRFSSKMTPFESRPGTRNRMLFAIVRAAFEPTSGSVRAIDVAALEPSSNRALSAISASGKHLPDRISKAAQSSLAPSGNALFVGRSAHPGK